MSKLIAKVRQWHDQFFGLVSYLQSPFLLFVRLYWGWQLAQSGWGKLHHLSTVAEYFASLGLPMPPLIARFSSTRFLMVIKCSETSWWASSPGQPWLHYFFWFVPPLR